MATVAETVAAESIENPRYDLIPEEISSLTAELLAQYPAQAAGKYVCYAMGGQDRFSNLGRSVEAPVLLEAFGNDATELKLEYGDYESASKFFVVIDTHLTRPVGALRVIENSPLGFKTLKDISGEPLNVTPEEFMAYHNVKPEDLSKTWDVGTVAVLPEYRGSLSDHLVSSALYRALYASAVEHNVEHFISVIDEHAYGNLAMLGIPFVPIKGSDYFEYIGSERSLAVYGRVTEFFDVMSKYKEDLHTQLRPIIEPYMNRLMFGSDVPPATVLPAAA